MAERFTRTTDPTTDVKAMLFTGKNARQIEDWSQGMAIDDGTGRLKVQTDDGLFAAEPGDWIAQSWGRKFSVHEAGSFANHYTLLDAVPNSRKYVRRVDGETLVCDVVIWNKLGDHPCVEPCLTDTHYGVCERCGGEWADHGQIHSWLRDKAWSEFSISPLIRQDVCPGHPVVTIGSSMFTELQADFDKYYTLID